MIENYVVCSSVCGTIRGFHGEDEAIVVVNGCAVYNRESPDEVRAPPEVFGDVWTEKGR